MLAVALVAALSGSDAGRAEEAVRLEPGRRQLFVDDQVVARASGLGRTFHTPVKRGAVLKADRPSDGKYIAAVSAPMWIPDEKLYKLVYETRHRGQDPAQTGNSGDAGFNHYALATSRDGLRWEKPALGLVEFEGSRANNLFPTPNDKRLWHVVYDPDDPDAERRYKGLVFDRGGHRPVVSRDGLRWTIEPGAPLLASGDAGTLTYDRDRRRFLALMKFSGPTGRSYNVYVSEDFRRWSGPDFLFAADATDQKMAIEVIRRRLANPALAKPLFVSPDPALGWRSPAPPAHARAVDVWRAEIYNMGVFPYEGVYFGWFQLFYPTGVRLPEWRNTDGFNLIQIAMSRDLKGWLRLGERQTFIGPSGLDQGLVGNYDRLQLGVTSRPVVHDDELRFYYGGMKCRVTPYERYTDGTPRDPSTLSASEKADWLDDTWSAVHLAVLRRDGFVSWEAGDAAGLLVTKSFKAAGRELFLNLDAPEGVASVGVLDEAGRAIPGFAPREAHAVKGDRTRTPVSWASGASWSALSGRTVQLEIRLRRAHLYAFWVE
jgi:hypothetical protein